MECKNLAIATGVYVNNDIPLIVEAKTFFRFRETSPRAKVTNKQQSCFHSSTSTGSYVRTEVIAFNGNLSSTEEKISTAPINKSVKYKT